MLECHYNQCKQACFVPSVQFCKLYLQFSRHANREESKKRKKHSNFPTSSRKKYTIHIESDPEEIVLMYFNIWTKGPDHVRFKA